MSTRALVVEGPGRVPVVTTLTIRAPLPDEVLVEVVATGVCHTDLSWAAGLLGEPLPAVLGHETSGVVREVGAQVDTVSPGDRVVIALTHHCGHCRDCVTGHPMLCAERTAARPRLAVDGEPVFQGFGVGGFAEHVLVRASSCIRVPDSVPLEAAAVVGCAIATGVGAALNIARVTPGARVVVFGAGGIGASVIMGCALAGAERIVAVDPDGRARERSLALGATDAVPPDAGGWEGLGDDGYDFVFESAGSTAAMERAVGAARRGGSITLIGAPDAAARMSLPALDFVASQKTLHGCLTGDVNPVVDFDRYFRLYARGRLPLDALLGAQIDLESAAAVLTDGPRTPGRTIVRPGAVPAAALRTTASA